MDFRCIDESVWVVFSRSLEREVVCKLNMEISAKDSLILVADDDDDALSLVTLGVSTLDLKLVQARDGNEALKLFREHSPDLAVLDLMMPGLNGREVCRAIKQSEVGRLTPVLILTSCDSVQDKVLTLEGGADDYLTKPFHLQELQARIKALLRVRQLNLSLWQKNQELVEAQKKLVEQERQLLVNQLAGTAAHQLGQPLSAIILNCHLLDRLSPEDARFQQAVQAIRHDAKRMAEMIERLKTVDATKRQDYHGKTQILELKQADEPDKT